MKAVVLTFDRLPASLLGCYGNEWIETPHFDRLAAESTVFPQAFAEIPGPASAEHPWWTGQFEFFRPAESSADWVSDPAVMNAGIGTESEAATTDNRGVSDRTLFEILTASGVSFRFLSERADGLPPRGVTVEEPSAAEPRFEVVSGDDGLDVEHSAVPFARLIDRATEILDGPANAVPDLLWLHSRGVPSPWLPPEFFAGLYLDELEDQDDSEATGREIADALLEQLRHEPDLVRLLLTDPSDDADEAEADADLIAEELGALGDRVRKYVFAGYVSLIDHCLQRLIETVSDRDDTLLIVTAAGGVSFGERAAFLAGDSAASQLAEADDDVCDSLVRVPLLVRPPGPSGFGNRSLRMIQSPDISRAVLAWLTESSRQSASQNGRSQLAVRLLSPTTGGEAEHAEHPVQTAVHLGAAGTIALRSAEWLLTVADGLAAAQNGVDADQLETQAGLYLQPDDRWGLNNLTRLQPDVCADMVSALLDRVRAEAAT